MSETEYMISTRARILSNVAKRKIRRGRREEDSLSLSGGSDQVISKPPLKAQTLNPHTIKMYNDMQAFQRSGMLTNNLSYASSTPMVNQMGANLRNPAVNPRLIDHLFHNQLRIHGDHASTAPSSPMESELSPVPIMTPPGVVRDGVIDYTGLVFQFPEPILNSQQNPIIDPQQQRKIHQQIANHQHIANHHKNTNHQQIANHRQIANHQQITNQQQIANHHQIVNHHQSIAIQTRHPNHQPLNSQIPPGRPDRHFQARKREAHQQLGARSKQTEMLAGCYVVGNKQNSGHFQPKNNRKILETDPNHIRCIPNISGPTDLMGYPKTKVHLMNLPSQSGGPYSKHGDWKEEYHGLVKHSNKLDIHHHPHISQIIPYAKLEPSPLSSSPGSSPIFVNKYNTANHGRIAPKLMPRQQIVITRKTSPSEEHVYENDGEGVILRNTTNKINRYGESAKKLSYIKEQDSSMSGESLEKHGSNKALKRSTELTTSHEDEEKYLPDIVKEIFSEMEEFEKEKRKVKTLSADSGKPSSDTSNSSSLKRNSSEGLHKSASLNRENRTSSKSGSTSSKTLSLTKRLHDSPQLEAVRKMEGEKKTGENTRKYNAEVEDEASTAEDSTATLVYDTDSKSWKLYRSALNAQLFLQEVNKRVTERKLMENVDYVVTGPDKPHIPLLDPRAHALTDAECSPMLQPIEHRYPTTPGTASSLPTKIGELSPFEGFREAYPAVDGFHLPHPGGARVVNPALSYEEQILRKGETALETFKRERQVHDSRKISRAGRLCRGDSIETGVGQSQPNTSTGYQQYGRASNPTPTFNNDIMNHQIMMRTNQNKTSLTIQNPNVVLPDQPEFLDEYFSYGDDTSEFGRAVEDTESLLREDNMEVEVTSKPRDVIISGPAPPGQVLDPHWELSSSSCDESFVSEEDENVGLISRRRSSTDSTGIIDTIGSKFMQFLEENKESEGILGNAAKFLIEKAEESSMFDSDTGKVSEEEEEPYVPQRKRIADDTLLGMIKREEWRKQEETRNGIEDPEERKRQQEVDYLIKTRPISFDKNKILYEVDYQGQEGNSVAKAGAVVNGSGTSRNAPPPQYGTLSEFSLAKKQAALEKHREWEVKKAAKMGVSVEVLREMNNSNNSPGSAKSCSPGGTPREKRQAKNSRRQENRLNKKDGVQKKDSGHTHKR